ncbi:hypothetical protein F8M41_021206 [Gigaspora margarita]|uniref:Uncharacterized protein n=1 Tax=Gigaspora margarita TaxID=4874 RepID=A0A8H4B1M4_GIGMA|nr:hypothetical protein F8M41_021206 [Gigaspora margarita]
MGHIKTKNTVCLEPFLLEDRGFVAWEQLTGEGGVERNIYNNNTQINQCAIYNNAEITNFVTHNTNYDSTQNGYVKEISGIKPSRPLTRNRDRFKRNGKTFNINPNRTSIILNTLDFYQQLGDSSSNRQHVI